MDDAHAHSHLINSLLSTGIDTFDFGVALAALQELAEFGHVLVAALNQRGGVQLPTAEADVRRHVRELEFFESKIKSTETEVEAIYIYITNLRNRRECRR